MAFNLGAFAGGLVSGGLKTYTSLKEQERLEGIEARDKTRFEEEQRKIELQRQAEDIARKAVIPEGGGEKIGTIAEAIPRSALYAGNEKGLTGRSEEEVAANEQAFVSALKGLTPEQQALVLRGYGDTSNAGGREFEAKRRADTEGKYGIPTGLNTAVVREDPSGERFVVSASTDEKAIVARHKQLAMASGNPVAIKAAHEAEATMLNRQVAQQQLAVGEQNIDLNKYKIKAAKTEQEFKDSWSAEMKGAKDDHFKLMTQIDTAATDPKASLDSLVSQFGPKLKDVTGQTYSVADGKIVTTGADGKTVVVASDVGQAVSLLKQAATNNFAQDFQDRILSKGLFEKPADLAAFIKDKQDFFFKTGELATKQITAAAATKNAESAAVAASASATTAKASADKVAAELKAGIPEAHASLYRAQAGSASAMADHYRGLTKLANENAALNKSTREEVQAALAEYEKLTPAQQAGEEGVAALAKASMIYAKKSGDITGLINAIKKPDGSDIKPADVATFVQNFGSSASSFRDEKGNFKPISQLNPQEAMEEMRRMMGGKGAGAGGLPDTAPKPEAGPAKAADAAPKAAIPPYVPPAGSPAAIEVEKRKAAADAKEQATKTLRDTATAAATAAISASSQVDARKVQQMDGFSLLPVAVQAQISQIVNKPATAIPASKASAPAAPAAAAIAATPAQVKAKLEAKIVSGERMSTDELNQAKSMGLVTEKSVPAAPAAAGGKSTEAQEQNLGYDFSVARDEYRDKPSPATKKQLEKAEKALADFRKANGIK